MRNLIITGILMSGLAAASSQTNPPVILSISPGLGPVGAGVTVLGQGFDPASTNNTVYFGAVRATVVSASPTNLLVTVPTGATYGPITVTVNGLTAFSNGAFEPSFFGSSSLSISNFAPPVTLSAAGIWPIRVVIADLNNDGKPDLVVANVVGHSISIYQNISTNGTLSGASFAAPFSFNVGVGTYDPYSVTVGDVDGDGRLDLLVPDSNNNVVTIYRNVSNGGPLSAASFAAPVSFAVGTDPRKVALRDLDGDGRPDLITANFSGNSISVLRNIGIPGSLAFAPHVDFATGSSADDVALGDLDGDGKPDIAVAVPFNNVLSIFQNTSTPGTIDTNSLASRLDLPAPSLPISAAIGDIDGDGKPDLLLGSYTGQALSVYRNLSSPGSLTSNSFAPRIDFPAGNGFRGLDLADLNGDGKPDVIQVGEGPSKMSINQNLSTPGIFTNSSLGPRIDFSATANNAQGVSVGDLDGDGRPDIVFVNVYDYSLSIFQNIAPTNPPPIPINGLIAYYPFHGNAMDASGNGNDGIPTNILSSTNRFGLSGTAFQFNGSDSLVTVDSLASTNLTELTVSAWVNVPSSPQAPVSVLNKFLGFSFSLEDYNLQINSDLTVEIVNGGHGSPVGAISTNPISLGTWCQIVTSIDSAGVGRIWINGAFSGQGYVSPLLAPASQPVRIGEILLVDGRIVNAFDGMMSDVRLYNRALSATEVSQLYQYESQPAPSQAPTINLQPQSVTVHAGDTTSFSVLASGTGLLNYQWALNNMNISGATSSTIAISNATQADLGAYSVTVSNAYGTVTSSNAMLSMYPFLNIPFGGVVAYWGQDTTLSVQAWGTGPLSYQWFKNGSAILNATNQTLEFPSIQFTNAGLYSVVVSNTFGSVTNTPAQVVVNPAGVTLGLYPGVTVTGVVGYTYIIQSNPDLANTNGWTTVATLTLTQPVQLWIDVSTNASLPANPRRFYRVLPGS